MATPIQDGYDENAASGIRRVTADGETVEMHDLDSLRRAAEDEAKQQASNSPRLGIKMFRVRTGRASPQ